MQGRWDARASVPELEHSEKRTDARGLSPARSGYDKFTLMTHTKKNDLSHTNGRTDGRVQVDLDELKNRTLIAKFDVDTAEND